MASLDFDNPDFTEALLMKMEAKMIRKSLEDKIDDLQKTSLFLSELSTESIQKLITLVRPAQLNTQTFDDIKNKILEHIKPRKRCVIAERAKFMNTKQAQEDTLVTYLSRLKESSKFCEFDKLTSSTAEEEMILMRFVDGLYSDTLRQKLLESIQMSTSGKLTLDNVVNMAKQFEMLNLSNTSQPHEVCRVTRQQPLRTNTIPSCRYCGTSHAVRKCPAYGKECLKCGRKNHFSKVCRSKEVTELKEEQKVEEKENNEENVYQITNGRGPTLTKVKIDGCPIDMLIDTGSDVTIISEDMWQRIGKPKLSISSKILRQFDGSKIPLMGKCSVLLEHENKYIPVDIIVTKVKKTYGLLGNDVVNYSFSVQELTGNDRKLGCLKNFSAKLELKAGARPIFHESRHIPLHMKKPVERELNRLVQEDVLEPINGGGSEWASPIVCVRKSDGGYRICGDYKVGINSQLKSDSYLAPNIETVFSEMAGTKVYCKIDLESAYFQIPLDEESKAITTISTPIGLFRYKRLPFGIKTASAIFQKALEHVIGPLNMKNLIIYQDDILVGAADEQTLKHKCDIILDALRNAGLTINLGKCDLKAVPSVVFLGYSLSSEGVTPDVSLVERLNSIQPPTNKKTLESFLGLCQYYAKFIPRYSEIISPMNDLRSKSVPFTWSERQQQAFDRIKTMLTNEPVLKHFDTKEISTLTCDASQNSIAAVLSQNDHPVMYISRKLTQCESQYSNIEREALAIVWAVERCKQFLMGAKFRINTDHQPLEYILNPRRELPRVVSSRLLRWALRLMEFDFEILYIPGKKIPHVDALSRLSTENEINEVNESCYLDINICESGTSLLSTAEMKLSTVRDSMAQDVIKRVKDDRWSGCSSLIKPFKNAKGHLSIVNDIIMFDDRFYVPEDLRRKAIKSAHSTAHPGISATCSLIMRELWWPGMRKDIQHHIEACECQERKPPNQKSTHEWPKEILPWSRVHMDHAYIRDVGLVLIVVDAMSGWPEVIRVRDRSAKTCKTVLQGIFSRMGVPHTLVSDNAAEFWDHELISWLLRIGCKPLKCPPYHPASNGQAERMVRTIKSALQGSGRAHNFDDFLNRLLLNYRVTPHGARKQAPDELLGRMLRNPLTCDYHIGQELVYWNGSTGQPENVTYAYQKGRNTAVVEKEGRRILVHFEQIKPKVENSEEEDEQETSNAGSNPDGEVMDEETTTRGTMDGEVTGCASDESQETHPRRSSRQCKVPERFSDYVLREMNFL